MFPALMASSVALDSTLRTMRTGGLVLPISARASVDTMPTPASERRIDPYKRWTDQDHDELVRQTERMRSMDDTLKQLFGNIADLRSETRASIDQLSARMKIVEDRNTRQDGAEAATLQSAKAIAHARAMQVSIAVALLGVIINQLGTLIVKALSAH